MGMGTKATQFLLAERARGVSFDRTATIGRQQLGVPASWLHRQLRLCGFDVDRRDAERLLSESGGFAESCLRLLGAKEVVSVDASDYEGASRKVDLNQPLPADLEEAFTAVIDLGSLEHVFDFPAAVRNCMRMVDVNGHFLSVAPANNWAGHGFYQFSPELFYRVLAPPNGFQVERMLITERSSARWYEVRDPADTGVRGVFTTFCPVDLCVAARRGASGSPSSLPPPPAESLRVDVGQRNRRGRSASHQEIRARHRGEDALWLVQTRAGHRAAVRPAFVPAGRRLRSEAAVSALHADRRLAVVRVHARRQRLAGRERLNRNHTRAGRSGGCGWVRRHRRRAGAGSSTFPRRERRTGATRAVRRGRQLCSPAALTCAVVSLSPASTRPLRMLN